MSFSCVLKSISRTLSAEPGFRFKKAGGTWTSMVTSRAPPKMRRQTATATAKAARHPADVLDIASSEVPLAVYTMLTWSRNTL